MSVTHTDVRCKTFDDLVSWGAERLQVQFPSTRPRMVTSLSACSTPFRQLAGTLINLRCASGFCVMKEDAQCNSFSANSQHSGTAFFLQNRHIFCQQERSTQQFPNLFTSVLPVAAIDLETHSLNNVWKFTDARPLFVEFDGQWHYFGDYVAIALSTIPRTLWHLPECHFVSALLIVRSLIKTYMGSYSYVKTSGYLACELASSVRESARTDDRRVLNPTIALPISSCLWLSRGSRAIRSSFRRFHSRNLVRPRARQVLLQSMTLTCGINNFSRYISDPCKEDRD